MNPPGPETEGTPIRILLLEDNRLDADLTRLRLESLRMPVSLQVVETEADFCKALDAGDIDIVLADFMLPAFSGAEALAIVRERSPDLPFVVVSGVLGEEHAVEILKKGATDYVVKQRLQRLPMVVERAIAEAKERRQRIGAERALETSETNYRRLVDALRDYAVIGLNAEGRIRSLNRAAEDMLGFALHEMKGRSASLLYQGQEADCGSLHESLQNALQHESHSVECWMKRRDGTEFHASIVTTAIRNDAGSVVGFSKIIRDTTQARRAAEALEAAKEQAEAANAAKDRFLAMLSHELRTPLTPILAAVHLLEQESAQPASLEDVPAMIRRNVELEARLIDDLLDLTSITHNKLSLSLKPLDMDACLSGVVEMGRAQVRSKGQQMEVRLEAEHSLVAADAGRTQQIIWNVLKNAIKFTPRAGRIVIESFNPDADRYSVRISDNGIGISEAALTRIFSAFEQADISITREFGGLGLGLAIAHALAYKHDGELIAESAGPGRGARFTFTLPLLDPVPDEPEGAVSVERRAYERPLRILLVEDNEDTSRAMARLLKILGHEVSLANTVAIGKRLAQTEVFDLLVGDIGLPDGDGTEVAREFKRIQQKPSIAITGFGMDEDILKSQEAGFTAHVTKPVNFEHLSELISVLTQY